LYRISAYFAQDTYLLSQHFMKSGNHASRSNQLESRRSNHANVRWNDGFGKHRLLNDDDGTCNHSDAFGKHTPWLLCGIWV